MAFAALQNGIEDCADSKLSSLNRAVLEQRISSVNISLSSVPHITLNLGSHFGLWGRDDFPAFLLEWVKDNVNDIKKEDTLKQIDDKLASIKKSLSDPSSEFITLSFTLVKIGLKNIARVVNCDIVVNPRNDALERLHTLKKNI
jgi:hypothetical protein